MVDESINLITKIKASTLGITVLRQKFLTVFYYVIICSVFKRSISVKSFPGLGTGIDKP